MKKIKVSYMGQPLRDIYPHATKFQVLRYRFNKFMEKVVIVSVIAGMIYGGFKVGQMTTQATVTHANVEVEVVKEVPVKLKFEEIPILVKICKAESGGRQFNKDGSVVRGRVNPSDIGYCQINEYINNDEARRLGYDIFTEEGNKDYAIYLFLHRGTAPWNSSKETWSKM